MEGIVWVLLLVAATAMQMVTTAIGVNKQLYPARHIAKVCGAN